MTAKLFGTHYTAVMILFKVIVFAIVAAISTAKVCSPGPADVMFVVTSNSSLDKTSFQQKINVVENFVQSVNIGPNDVRVGMITEYDYADLEFHMNDHMNKPELSLAILFTYFAAKGVPSFGSGLQYIRENGIDNKLGGRPGVPDIVVFLTDGVPTDSSLAQTETGKLSDSGVTVIAIGGGGISHLDLYNMASGCHYIATAPNFSSPKDLALPIVNLTCNALNGVPVDECECELTAEVIFLLDASSSQGKDNYSIQKQFAQAITSELNIAANETRIAAVTYADFKHPQFDLDAHIQQPDAGLALAFLPYQGDDGRNVELGLDYINTYYTGSKIRASAKKIVVVVATGPLSSPSLAEAAASRLKNNGFTIYSVGVESAKKQEMANLATNSGFTKQFTFSNLLTGAKSLGKLLCQGKTVRTTMAPIITTLDATCTGSAPCMNGGKCVDSNGVKSCQCPHDYSGDVCQNKLPTQASTQAGPTLQYCAINVCNNGGTCVVLGDMYECRCPSGVTGLTCQDVVTTTDVTVTISTNPSVTTLNPTAGNCQDLNSTNWQCGEAEVIFLLEYGQVDQGNILNHEGDFAKFFIDKFDLDNQHIRVGIVVYNDTIREAIHLDDYEGDKVGLKGRIDLLMTELKPSGKPDLAKALEYIRQNSFTNARQGVPKVVISVVHQMSNGTQNAIIQAGEKMKKDCISHIVNGVESASLNEDTLKQIASIYYSHSSFTVLEYAGYNYDLDCASP